MRYGHDPVLFFFSGRRRHTRLQGDWSSDVCSSDLRPAGRARAAARRAADIRRGGGVSTIKDIARRAGVSTATVSYVLNGTRTVSPERHQRVLAAIAELRYRPNAIAQSLRRKQTRTIGLVIPDNSNPFFAEVAKGVEDAGYEAGVSVILCNSDSSFDRELRYMELLQDKRVDGVIFI